MRSVAVLGVEKNPPEVESQNRRICCSEVHNGVSIIISSLVKNVCAKKRRAEGEREKHTLQCFRPTQVIGVKCSLISVPKILYSNQFHTSYFI